MTGRPALDFRLDADRFDAHWYRSAYPDLAPGDAAAALAHFVDIGSREGRQPNADFAAEWYLATHPKAAAAVSEGRLDGAYHDYLRRLRDRLPRRPFPAKVTLGVDLTGADPHLEDLALQLAANAPGWQFWLLAPPGRLPIGAAGANVSIEADADRLPPIDLWLDLGPPVDTPAAGVRKSLPALMGQIGLAPTDRSPAALEQTLEALRRMLVEDCPLVPADRRSSGPIHLDSDRVPGLRLVVRRLAPSPRGGGVVLRGEHGIVAELPPPTVGSLTSRLAIEAPGDLWLTVSEGLAVELAPADPPAPGLDLIVAGGAGRTPTAWQRTVEAVAALAGTGRMIAVAPPRGLALPAGAESAGSLAEALGRGPAPTMLVPAGVRPFPQAVAQALACLDERRVSYAAASAIRHPDGHLAPWPDDPAADPGLYARWRRARVAVLTADERRHAAGLLSEGGRWKLPAAGEAAALAAIDVGAWPLRASRQPALAPGWMRHDARPDGGVLGGLRLHGEPLSAGGLLLLTGRADGMLAAACPLVARSAGDARTIDRFELPATGEFVWPIDLPSGAGSIEIAPDGPWRTAQDDPDARPLLFRLSSIRYRPSGSSRPREASRSR
ncbi:hypothetical protein [Thalassobaculum sp.]|uniref:hypothetical protein n=1 Tax=Thalassobaculum sp. TaxID=2022740 RepID=UPI0032ED2454